MPIRALHVGNFKGIASTLRIGLKPITILVGANSSGKSSIIHAIAALSQTLKIPNNLKPLSLDDQHADVHLGRFIEVVHSKQYCDDITLGVETPEIEYALINDGNKFDKHKGIGSAVFEFSCTLRTQELTLKQASYKIGSLEYRLSKSAKDKKYVLSLIGGSFKGKCELGPGFLINHLSIDPRTPHYMESFPLFSLMHVLEAELQNTLYLGPFRQSPQRRYPTRGASPREVGPQGEATVTLLANEVIRTKNRPHINKIKSWMQHLGLAEDLEVARVGKSDLFGVELDIDKTGKYSLPDLGCGMSQVLPVLCQCSFAREASTLLFEQPEIHLHSNASRRLARVFIDTAKEKSASIVIETHSPDLIKEFQNEIRDKNLSPDEIQVLKVSRVDGASEIEEIKIDGAGDIYKSWQEGITW
jgi:predicted ATPase